MSLDILLFITLIRTGKMMGKRDLLRKNVDVTGILLKNKVRWVASFIEEKCR